ncbi:MULTISPECIES: Stk1 family PASTA domain-containing Ser/Thr kinase [Actinomyces]|uniref:non-specific serine/threonine protein kinase n=1 Tax=Actinomyces respiraculi TaxID=2744574 RepID=A0A7T0LLP6_9ACTO|nr:MULTISPECIES: Stk1 family PASTA domain-containing Ser/Thr kinase [Actinomyces]QPL05448.1 Stk1 family PASTA domain-containing Ser/Thr kinase [Actinomyces respiraculi]
MTGQHPQVLAGRYEIRELIGRGGMAEVHLGYDTRLSRIIAVKLLRSDIAGDPTFQARFRREATSAAALNHPSIVAVYDSGEEQLTSPDGSVSTVPYIVMEYVEGHTVRELLGEGEAVPIPEAVEIVTGVLDALEYSHRAGIVHRDIKPGNIMLTSTGAVKVMDFGIARAVEDSAATVTQTHAVVGTAQYLSPEQARGEIVDSRSDLYSAGCLLYELLTGQPPFVGDSAVAIAYQHVREIPRPPSSVAADVPEALDRVVLKSLAKNRDDRYEDAAHMRTDLLAAARGAAVLAPAVDTWTSATTVLASAPTPAPAPAPTPAPPAAQNAVAEEQDKRPARWWVWALIVALLIAAGIGIGLLMTDRLGGSTPAPTSTATAAAVPDVKGKSESEARQAIESVGLVFVKGSDVASDDIPSGQAVSSEPGAGTSALLGTEITVHFSAGSAMVEVPDVSDMTQEQAKEALEKAGLKVGTVTAEDSPKITKDKVVRTSPVAGTSVQRGESVGLVVSTGKTTVPDLTGHTQEQARQALEKAGLRVGDVVRGDSDAEHKDLVLSSDPAADSQVELGSYVSIVVGSGQAASLPVPDVRGMTQEQARQALDGFTQVIFQSRTTTNQNEDGLVVEVTPAPGSTISADTLVTVTLGKYQAATPTPTSGH